MAALNRNRWPLWIGFSGRFASECARKGEPATDFAIHGPETHGLANFVGLYGIESPGLTSSLAIGSYIAELLSDPVTQGT